MFLVCVLSGGFGQGFGAADSGASRLSFGGFGDSAGGTGSGFGQSNSVEPRYSGLVNDYFLIQCLSIRMHYLPVYLYLFLLIFMCNSSYCCSAS